MNRSSFQLLAVAALVGTVTPALAAQIAGEVIPNRYIVQLKTGVAVAPAARAHGVVPIHVFNRSVNGYAGIIPPGLLLKVAGDPSVEAIYPDRLVSIEAKPGGGGGGGSQVVPAGVTRIGAAPGSSSYNGTGVGVAIVDTGIDLRHADLGAPVDAFSTFGPSASAQDDQGHGTHVAGTVAALNNTRDVVGVAPGAKLYAVKVLNAQGSGSDSDIMKGLEWIAANAGIVNPPIKVANLSLGRPGSLDDNPALRAAFQAVVAAGVTVVVSAGNDCDLEVSQKVPATYPEVIAVASTTALDGTSPYTTKIRKDTASYFTTDGAFDLVTGIGVTVSAPGEDQENIRRGGFLTSVGILSTKLGGGTTRMSGTSMASPHVAGVCALLHQQLTGLSSEQVRGKLVFGAQFVNGVPLASPTTCYTADGDPEGVVSVPGSLAAP